MDIRQQKGQQIAARAQITRNGQLWLVPSEAGKGQYRVDVEKQRCSCLDFDFRRKPCKHLFAVQFTIEEIERTKTTVIEDGKTTVTETVKVTRKSYKQEWKSYNAAQTHEKERVMSLLSELCKGIDAPPQSFGRPRLPLADMLFASAFKVYSTMSGRRFTSDLRDAHSKGYMTKAPHYNSISRYLEDATLTPYLKMLIEQSALPLQAIETDFAVDSSGFSTGVYQKWFDAKWSKDVGYGKQRNGVVRQQDWLKAHICCGVQTNIITSIEITGAHAGDNPQFAPLVEKTAENFTIREVSADKAYSSAASLQLVLDKGGQPYIAFRRNSNADDKRQPAAWKKIYHVFMANQDEYMRHYHKRSNVETTSR
jgi:Transposase DDE domain/SWIM zinc finger